MFPPFFPVCRNNCHAVTKAVAHRPVINKRHKFIKHPHCFFIVLLFCRAVTDQHTAQHGFFKISIVCAVCLYEFFPFFIFYKFLRHFSKCRSL